MLTTGALGAEVGGIPIFAKSFFNGSIAFAKMVLYAEQK